jgi:hypothetical protein
VPIDHGLEAQVQDAEACGDEEQIPDRIKQPDGALERGCRYRLALDGNELVMQLGHALLDRSTWLARSSSSAKRLVVMSLRASLPPYKCPLTGQVYIQCRLGYLAEAGGLRPSGVAVVGAPPSEHIWLLLALLMGVHLIVSYIIPTKEDSVRQFPLPTWIKAFFSSMFLTWWAIGTSYVASALST